MLKHYLKIAVRHLRQQKVITAINIGGLSIGMACCILIILFVKNELSYDRFHKNIDNIYVLNAALGQNGEIDWMRSTQFPVGPAMKAEMKDVVRYVRILTDESALFSYQDKQMTEDYIYADADYFKLFSFPLVAGNPATVLTDPYAMVVTESIAKKYFGTTDAIGKTIRVGNRYNCHITGVAKDMPVNSDVKSNIIVSFATYYQLVKDNGGNLDNAWFYFTGTATYVQLSDHANFASVKQDLKKFQDRHISKIAKDHGMAFDFNLQPLSNMHLHYGGDENPRDNASRLIFFYTIIAAFILLIACFNFMNLVTARANERALEVGLRKVMGSERRGLIAQFLAESVLLSMMAFVISILLTLLVLPMFNAFSGKDLSLFTLQQLPLIGVLFLVALFVGLLAGSYPAFYLSAFLPISVLKGNFRSSGSRVWIRKGLVVAQFFITVVLIIATIVTESQIRYWHNKDLGFDKEHLLNVYLKYDESRNLQRVIKQEMLNSPHVVSATVSYQALGINLSSNPVLKTGETDDKSITSAIIRGDFDLVKTLNLKVIKGRNFSSQFATDSTSNFIINETMVKRMGLKDPIGTVIEWHPGGTVRKGAIVGVVKDFNYLSLSTPVGPAICFVTPNESVINIRLKPGNVSKQMADLESTWKKLVPGFPFETSFVSDDLAKQYVDTGRVARLFGIFSLLSIFIACMGLFGLSILISRQRMKEIGIRKVLGASIMGITTLLSKDFLKLVTIAIILATPVAWYMMNKWLENFAYRITIEWWMLAVAAITSIFIALLTVSFQSVKAALMNPVRSLKTE
jgi:putative ABC transport system permease protein